MNCRYELFTSTLSTDNLRLYESVGCGGFDKLNHRNANLLDSLYDLRNFGLPYIEDIQFIRKTDFLILRKPVLEVISEPYF